MRTNYRHSLLSPSLDIYAVLTNRNRLVGVPHFLLHLTFLFVYILYIMFARTLLYYTDAVKLLLLSSQQLPPLCRHNQRSGTKQPLRLLLFSLFCFVILLFRQNSFKKCLFLEKSSIKVWLFV